MSSKNTVLNVGYTVSNKSPNLVLHIDDDSLKEWNREIFGMIEAAGAGAQDLVENMTNAILSQSRKYVPTDTFTLYNSGYTEVETKRAVYMARGAGSAKTADFVTGTVGYGDNEAAGGPNPITGIQSSVYAWKVHEDLTAKHPNGGQAKFLERAYREYVASELGPEMVQLERSIYMSSKYTPVMRYGTNFREFTGKWTRKRRTERKADSVSNLDRLSEVYSKAKRR